MLFGIVARYLQWSAAWCPEERSRLLAISILRADARLLL
jgi:hypothetical protein